MKVASTGKARELAEVSEENGGISVTEITSLTDTVLGFRLGTTTRAQLDHYVPRLAKELNGLLGKDLGAEDDPDAQELVRRATRLVELSARPTAETPTFGTFFYLRDIANLSRRLLWLYTDRHGLGAP
ncbi:hypothetical protein D9753_12710 [Streptomyces dangxiongensis]|uniref:Uncharacterized protein n=1 Tax=Streptomyces dangxiongensis TaxID=1442032 RepID=A0A3G2JBD0_9ACTN|nr:hypothetical protein [Streptomyces dangxiongensis]AYN39640.1 hypothetical protein D9753_12710 [Streptomyces dangxiongensis]